MSGSFKLLVIVDQYKTISSSVLSYKYQESADNAYYALKKSIGSISVRIYRAYETKE